MRNWKEHRKAEAQIGCGIVLCHRADSQPYPSFAVYHSDQRQPPASNVCFMGTARGCKVGGTWLRPLCATQSEHHSSGLFGSSTHWDKSGGPFKCALS